MWCKCKYLRDSCSPSPLVLTREAVAFLTLAFADFESPGSRNSYQASFQCRREKTSAKLHFTRTSHAEYCFQICHCRPKRPARAYIVKTTASAIKPELKLGLDFKCPELLRLGFKHIPVPSILLNGEVYPLSTAGL